MEILFLAVVKNGMITIRLRILKLSLLQSDPLVGQIEVDESYFAPAVASTVNAAVAPEVKLLFLVY